MFAWGSASTPGAAGLQGDGDLPAERAGSPLKYTTHPGREWFYVLAGAVILALSDQRTVLEAGEAAEFDTMTPHLIANAREGRPAEIIALYSVQGERLHVIDV
ncbi:cupin domain-containing protein [Tomitella biformata]|uniref:cupin domain-containing protein n=1 Tax=Tomitella biformata TaxID=630403 RepID=UPI0004B25370|nr:cupin domain-containing protein [Tomitella biformata]